jgi:hypothetical protein
MTEIKIVTPAIRVVGELVRDMPHGTVFASAGDHEFYQRHTNRSVSLMRVFEGVVSIDGLCTWKLKPDDERRGVPYRKVTITLE